MIATLDILLGNLDRGEDVWVSMLVLVRTLTQIHLLWRYIGIV